MNKKISLSAILIVLLMMIGFINKGSFILAEEELIIKDEREFKAVWMSTFIGEAPYSNENQFKNHMYEAFEIFEYYGINALVFHVRTHNNAYYPSELNPLTSSWRNVNFEVFDPISWLIDESHKRGIEFHAWMNPYRVSTGYQTGPVPAANPQNNPENLITEGNATILNPAKEEVRQHIFDTIDEFINLYPTVDAIHFDDYFYIQTNAKPLEPSLRRWEIDKLISGIHDLLEDFNERNNTAIQLGISPTGIYQNGDGEVTYDEDGNPITTGSLSNGFAHYGNYLYADTLKWSVEGWIDYLTPQTYWARNHYAASYTNLVDWWDKAFKYLNANLYSGIGVYMADGDDNFDWLTDMYEMDEQLKIIEEKEHIKGYTIFSYKHLKGGYLESNSKSGQQIRNAYSDINRRKIRVLPEVNSMRKLEAPYVSNVNLLNGNLTWDKVEGAKFYYIYHSEEELTYSSDEIIGVIGQESEVMSFDVSSYNGNFGVRSISPTNHLSDVLSNDEVSVTFKNEDEITSTIITRGSTVSSKTLEKEGYLFLGWYLNDEEFDFETKINTNITLIAKWEKIIYYVNLTLHYGYDSILETIKVEEGTIPEKPVDPTRVGYTFLGWYFNDSEYSFSEALTRNITLVARWEEKQYTVEFDFNYSNVITTVNVLEGQTVEIPKTPVREGYVLVDWRLNNESFDFLEPVMGNLKLFAVWEKISELDVTLINQDEVEIIKVLKYDYLIITFIPEQKGYKFIGWYLDDQLFDFNMPITTNITLIAVFEELEKVTVTFINDDMSESYETLINEKIKEPFTPHKENYLFTGWYLNDNLYDFNNIVLSDITLVAKYETLTELKDVSIYQETTIKESNNEKALVYYGIINKDESPKELGFYLVYGTTSYDEFYLTVITNKTLIINNKEVYQVKVKNVKTDGTYSVKLTGIPEAGYNDLITVIPYIINSEGQTIIAKTFKVSTYNHAKNISTTLSKIENICLLNDLKRKDELF